MNTDFQAPHGPPATEKVGRSEAAKESGAEKRLVVSLTAMTSEPEYRSTGESNQMKQPEPRLLRTQDAEGAEVCGTVWRKYKPKAITSTSPRALESTDFMRG